MVRETRTMALGTNMVYVDRENDLIIVARWIANDKLNELVKTELHAK